MSGNFLVSGEWSFWFICSSCCHHHCLDCCSEYCSMSCLLHRCCVQSRRYGFTCSSWRKWMSCARISAPATSPACEPRCRTSSCYTWTRSTLPIVCQCLCQCPLVLLGHLHFCPLGLRLVGGPARWQQQVMMDRSQRQWMLAPMKHTLSLHNRYIVYTLRLEKNVIFFIILGRCHPILLISSRSIPRGIWNKNTYVQPTTSRFICLNLQNLASHHNT